MGYGGERLQGCSRSETEQGRIKYRIYPEESCVGNCLLTCGLGGGHSSNRAIDMIYDVYGARTRCLHHL
jgi:hypothetical protein